MNRALLLAALALLSTPAHASMGGETIKLLAADGALEDLFGGAVAIQGNLAVVGALLEDDGGLAAGAAYLFDVRTGDQIAKLVAEDPTAGDVFGAAVAIGGNLVVVGAPYALVGRGAVYVFDAESSQQVLEFSPSGARFVGASVGVSGSIAIAGAPGEIVHGVQTGSAYVFDVETGDRLARLLADDGAAGDSFGARVAISGSLAIVGAHYDGDNGPTSGSAYLFDAASGTQLAKLLPTDGAAGDRFGAAVAISGTLAVVGAHWHDAGATNGGAAYVFDTMTGQQVAKLLPQDIAWGDGFGVSVAIRGSRVLVGSSAHDDPVPGGGAAYLFEATTGEQLAKLVASDGDYEDRLGWSVAMTGARAVVGAFMDDGNGLDAGSAYVFDITQSLASPYCFGSGAGTPCPCANSGAPGNGCANSVFPDGARLRSTGSPCVGADELVLRVTGSRPGQPGVFFQGKNALADGLGIPFGDGLRCAGGDVLRLELATADAAGSASSSIALAATAGLSAGDVARYQWWYRDPGASPCGNELNLSNGLEVVWGP